MAIDDGSIKDLKVREELCRNITALILDAMVANSIYQQCVKILEEIVKGDLTDEAKVRASLNKIPNFHLIPKQEQDKIVKQVMGIDLNGNVNQQISNICLTIASLITGILKDSLAYQQCIKVLEEIIAENITDPVIIRQKLTSSITNFNLLSEELQKKFVNDISIAMQQGNLDEKKEEICLAIASAIYEALGKNEVYLKCVSVIEQIFKDQKNKDRDHIISELNKIPGFNLLNSSKPR